MSQPLSHEFKYQRHRESLLWFSDVSTYANLSITLLAIFPTCSEEVRASSIPSMLFGLFGKKNDEIRL